MGQTEYTARVLKPFISTRAQEDLLFFFDKKFRLPTFEVVEKPDPELVTSLLDRFKKAFYIPDSLKDLPKACGTVYTPQDQLASDGFIFTATFMPKTDDVKAQHAICVPLLGVEHMMAMTTEQVEGRTAGFRYGKKGILRLLLGDGVVAAEEIYPTPLGTSLQAKRYLRSSVSSAGADVPFFFKDADVDSPQSLTDMKLHLDRASATKILYLPDGNRILISSARGTDLYPESPAQEAPVAQTVA